MTNDYETLLVETDGGLCQITLNNPKNLNALSSITIGELRRAFGEIEHNKNIRVVVVTGAGKAFVAGADIAHMATLTPDEAMDYSAETTALYRGMTTSKKVFIAAINGFALGGGTEFALACDIRVASEKARFGLPEVGLGILPGGGGTQRLPRLIGQSRAMELILTGDIITAREALECGLVGSVVEEDQLLPHARGIAGRIMKNAPLAVQYARKCVRESEELPLGAGMDFENGLFGACFATADQKEGMAAFLEKRTPAYKGM